MVDDYSVEIKAWGAFVLEVAMRRPGGTFTLDELGQAVMDLKGTVVPYNLLTAILEQCPHVLCVNPTFAMGNQIWRHALVPWISIPFDCQEN